MMDYRNSQKYSHGYAEPEQEYSTKYQENRSSQQFAGFGDSLENFYYDRPAAIPNKSSDFGQDKSETVLRDDAYYNAGYQKEPPKNSGEYVARYSFESERTDDCYNGAQQEINQNLSKRYEGLREEPQYAEDGMKYTDETDLMPSETTMGCKLGENVFEDYHEKGETVDKKYTINTKGKILIAVYALVVVTVFALIILNTRLLKNMNAAYTAKETEISRLTKEVDDLNRELDYVSSDEVIEQKAEEKGMIKG